MRAIILDYPGGFNAVRKVNIGTRGAEGSEEEI